MKLTVLDRIWIRLSQPPNFLRIIRLKPDYVLAYLRLADIYRHIGNDGSSLSFYNRFLELASPRKQLDTEVRRVNKELKNR
jgi:hypothetical protein